MEVHTIKLRKRRVNSQGVMKRNWEISGRSIRSHGMGVQILLLENYIISLKQTRYEETAEDQCKNLHKVGMSIKRTVILEY